MRLLRPRLLRAHCALTVGPGWPSRPPVRRMRRTLIGILLRSFPLHSIDYARETPGPSEVTGTDGVKWVSICNAAVALLG
jgi:hypothetical protein